jgi:hypothetical protein
MEPDPGHDRRERIWTILLFLALGAAFLAVGLAFTSTRVFVEEADLFDADARRVVRDLARRYGPRPDQVHLVRAPAEPAGALLGS